MKANTTARVKRLEQLAGGSVESLLVYEHGDGWVTSDGVLMTEDEVKAWQARPGRGFVVIGARYFPREDGTTEDLLPPDIRERLEGSTTTPTTEPIGSTV